MQKIFMSFYLNAFWKIVIESSKDKFPAREIAVDW